MEDRTPVRQPVNIIWQREAASSEHLQKLVTEMVTIISKDVIVIGLVSLAHPWDQNVVDLVLCQLANTGNAAIHRVFYFVVNWDRTLKDKLSVLSWCRDINARLVALRVTSKCELISPNLNRTMKNTQSNWAAICVALLEVFQAVDVDIQSALPSLHPTLLLSRHSRVKNVAACHII